MSHEHSAPKKPERDRPPLPWYHGDMCDLHPGMDDEPPKPAHVEKALEELTPATDAELAEWMDNPEAWEDNSPPSGDAPSGVQ